MDLGRDLVVCLRVLGEYGEVVPVAAISSSRRWMTVVDCLCNCFMIWGNSCDLEFGSSERDFKEHH